MKKERKDKEIRIRCTKGLLRKLMAICVVTGETKTAVITDLILSEYAKNTKYQDEYIRKLNSEES